MKFRRGTLPYCLDNNGLSTIIGGLVLILLNIVPFSLLEIQKVYILQIVSYSINLQMQRSKEVIMQFIVCVSTMKTDSPGYFSEGCKI